MKIRQEDSTPIGDWFHNNGVQSVFESVKNQVDEFDVDTERLANECDILINLLKGLKGQVKKVEAAWQKSQTQKKIMEAFCES
ncbi:MAG: hypothetical protein J6V90_08325 [Treponema sp.]|nr:hypothetical protein [Treponema sp.]